MMMSSSTESSGALMGTRSSLEEMLDSLRRRDEAEKKPKDLPPALPSRPTSRARLPSARKSLPSDFRVGGEGDGLGKGEVRRKEKEFREFVVGSFGVASKKMRMDRDLESPYVDEEGMGCGSGSEPEDSIGYFFSKNLRIWCRLPSGKWLSGNILSSTREEVNVSLSNGNVVKVSTGELLPANPDILEGVDDLIQLSYINEPSVVHNLHCRYLQNKIYSKAGPVLIAVNPFKDVPIYGNAFVNAYRNNLIDTPHIFAIADGAYHKMMEEERNQSIIISGESGAGKTESAKFSIQYLVTFGSGNVELEQRIIYSNHILEAFGNAKTYRNCNSSRHGKLIELHFSASGKICGARVHTLLLEKSRVVQLANGERSYHIFYQLCAGAPSSLRERLNLKLANEYSYLNQSECLAIDGVDDAHEFNKLMEALDILQIGKEDQDSIFALLAAVLWLGNISFKVFDNENHVEVLANEAVTTTARLIGCSPQELMLALSTHKIEGGAKKLTLQQANNTRDALAKYIYESLFYWLVEQMNESLGKGQNHTWRSINVLDIYGFESSKKNSLEQFCINYANERLQQHFNRHLFKLEQEEYELDGIDWTKVAFEDNEECLNLLEKKPLGLLSIMDEESNIPMATDLTFSHKLKQQLSKNPCFKGERGRSFGIHHYAGEVTYDTSGFLEKNRDPLYYECIKLLSSCSCQLLQNSASKNLEQSHKHYIPDQSGPSDFQKQSVSTKLKGQLFKLMCHLENTTPHFVCCIKLNNRQLPGMCDEDILLQQLRCCNVLEVVRISRSGYPTRMTHQNFSERYGFLLQQRTITQDPLSTSIAILKQFNVHPDMYRVGFTKLYIRTGQIGSLEERRKQLMQCVIAVQKHIRGCQARRNFQELKSGVSKLQSFMTLSEQQKAVIHIQSVIRGMLVRKQCKYMPDLRKLTCENVKFKSKRERKASEAKVVPQDQVQNLSSVMEELQRQILKAETILGQKEKENALLKDKLQQYEKKATEYEEKMRTMEEMWQKQMTSMQMNLTAARKSLSADADNSAGQAGKLGTSSPPCNYDSEDAVSTISHTPAVSSPRKLPDATRNFGAREETNGDLNAVFGLVKEFEQKKRAYDDDVKSLEVKLGQSVSSMNPGEELRKLKLHFESWKKEYKGRLRDTKAKLHKHGNSGDRSRRKWWTKIGAR